MRNLKASTELKRLLLESYSPILSNVSELINGLSTIVAYKKTKMMEDAYNFSTNRNISSDLHEKYTISHLCIVSDYTTSI